MNDKEEIQKNGADELLTKVNIYLEINGWKLDNYTFWMIDPITASVHHTMTALNIQLDRDLAIKKLI